MNHEQKLLVQTSFRGLLGISDLVADLFYRRLFLLDPSLKQMFKGDIQQQGEKLISVLRVCVLGLDNVEQLIPTVEALGKRHVGYGVKDEDYDTVATALLWAMQQGLGDSFTPAVSAAWVEVYTLLAGVMKAAAAEHIEELAAARPPNRHTPAYASLPLIPPAPPPSSRMTPPPSSRMGSPPSSRLTPPPSSRQAPVSVRA
jgi:hemoglobin-like flavoprotein